MANGLNITKSEFRKMTMKSKLDCVYENLEAIRGQNKNISFHQKIQYIIGTAMLAGLLFLFRIHL